MGRTLLYLVRHGEQDHAAGHAADGGLSDLGRQQAHSLGNGYATCRSRPPTTAG